MTSFRRLLVVAVTPLFLTALAGTPASAHGAMDNPVSRAVTRGVADWDNIRVADVDGRDRQLIPDGKLCSAGLEEFESLDVPDPDGPATKVSSGADFTFEYRETIPHKGTFRLYATKNGYDPSEPLSWSDLDAKPFLTATDPVSRNRSYSLDGKLPSGKTGRHVIYTIWQNSSTPDTYYSCSDVDFARAKSESAGESAGGAQASPTADTSAPLTTSEVAAPTTAAVSAASESTGDGSILPLAVTTTALLAAAIAIGWFLFRRRRA